MDFTLETYSYLIRSFIDQGFEFQTFEGFLNSSAKKSIILRHDVDKHPLNAVRCAEIEAKAGIKASYHFRIVKESFSYECLSKIVDMGHEIGYHYEDLSMAASFYKVPRKGQMEKLLEEKVLNIAYESFIENLKEFRQFYPVTVISMHGSPKSKYDSRALWTKFNYRDSGVVCEVYYDVDYSKILYLTDTGRRWDGAKYNLRDKIISGFGSTFGSPLDQKFKFKSTLDIIHAALMNQLPDQIIINTHPQRWTNSVFPWLSEFVWQNTKNIAKYLLIKIRNKTFTIDNSHEHLF